MTDRGEHRDLERLRRLETLTDADLSRLGAADLLDELLDRVRDLLDADTAVVLLLDGHARQLVATAAKGLAEDALQGFRVALGRGFASRIVATRQPVAVVDIAESDMVSPVMQARGVRSLLGVPILVAGEVVGVLHVGTLVPRVFTGDDIRLLQAAADRAGVAGRIRSHRLELATALALQRSLLPTRLPAAPGLDLAARYVPGHDFGIGGDWYDVFPLPSGWLGAVIGDVSGHGLSAAVVMGRVRSALRAYALISDDPAEALTMLNRKVHHFEAGSMTTAVYAMISPNRSIVRLSSAGHLRPVMAVPGRGASQVEMPTDPPLGVGRPRGPRHCTEVRLPDGAVLVFYTDGLVERRHQIIDAGIDRLTGIVRPAPAETVCTTILTGIAMEQPTDDVALLAVRRTG